MIELLESARQELATEHPEQYKIFLLGLMAGLRRNEIDVLPWERVPLERRRDPRRDNRALLPEVAQFGRGRPCRSRANGSLQRRKSKFVVESNSPPPAFDAPYGEFRCVKEMRALLAWLRPKGVISKTPLHTLRNEFDSQINARCGLLPASEQLRHGGVVATARSYVESRNRPVLGLGHLLKESEPTIIPMDKAQAS
jgi:hypothetical protein